MYLRVQWLLMSCGESVIRPISSVWCNWWCWRRQVLWSRLVTTAENSFCCLWHSLSSSSCSTWSFAFEKTLTMSGWPAHTHKNFLLDGINSWILFFSWGYQSTLKLWDKTAKQASMKDQMTPISSLDNNQSCASNWQPIELNPTCVKNPSFLLA